MALDSQNSQSVEHCFKFYVSQSAASNCPGDPIFTSTTTTTAAITTSTIRTCWGIYEENGPFELYHIDRCTDRECQWSCASISRNIKFSTNAKNILCMIF
ncbi:unnamed protein product [Rotaria sp. Silwood2]|nr:unnamed protein product [Rotaria sp. Silwood2]CAF2636902.1 unnamed protein product [Rotaria sp. Silwood2]CAF2875560.1 unnamed protein product [Rotaria sp. Silwood2]CAF3031518.1 unnamed protein product [Rotaria sp. Silwood2]